jgi:hypothetical protein
MGYNKKIGEVLWYLLEDKDGALWYSLPQL